MLYHSINNNLGSIIDKLTYEEALTLPANNAKQSYGYIYRYGKMATMVLSTYTDKVYVDNTDYMIANNVPKTLHPHGEELVFINGNWENDQNNVFRVLFKDNGNNTDTVYITPLKGNVVSGAYINGRMTYICSY